MADDFKVFHGDYGDVNAGLRLSLQNMDQVMSDLTATLNTIGVATQGRATPLWQDNVRLWSGAYTDMQNLLGEHTASSETVADLFIGGDEAAYRAMS